MSKLLIRPIGYSVYREGENPIFGELVTHVTLDDEGGGLFLRLKQAQEKPGEVVLDFDEFEVICEVVKKLQEEPHEIQKD